MSSQKEVATERLFKYREAERIRHHSTTAILKETLEQPEDTSGQEIFIMLNDDLMEMQTEKMFT